MLSSRATKLLLLGLLVVSVAIGLLAVWARQPGATKLTNWPPPLDEQQARSQLKSQCRAASDRGHLLLIEFSAPWCEHCRAVKQAASDDRVEAQLGSVWPLVLNVGSDAELNGLRRELGAGAIPAWVVVLPENCDESPSQWARVAQTNPRGDPQALAQFLADLTP